MKLNLDISEKLNTEKDNLQNIYQGSSIYIVKTIPVEELSICNEDND